MGKKLADLNYSNRLYKKAPFLFIKTNPTPLAAPQLIHVNSSLLKSMGLDISLEKNSSFLRFLNGDLIYDGLFLGASYYSGHQFGYYVPRLGDGRAIMLCEIENNKNFFELQLKGAGLTPFSRMGDGKAVWRSSLREYLASAHMQSLGVPTTQALSLILGNDDVYREEIEKSAMVLRVAESFLRFGHIQYFSQTNQKNECLKLLNTCIELYYKDFHNHPNKYVLFFQSIVKKTAQLFSKWQSLGFCHGVLNTDNMSLLGLTLDYGPFSFIENLDLDYICNHSDQEGRYSFCNQPAIGQWNLEQLGNSLVQAEILTKEDMDRTLESYSELFFTFYKAELMEKCGLYKRDVDDHQFIKSLLNMLVETQIDYTNFFRSLCFYQAGNRKLSNVDSNHKLLMIWLEEYDQRLSTENLAEEDRLKNLKLKNPKFILRNYMAQMIIENKNLIEPLFEVLSHPFDEWSEWEHFTKTTPIQYRNLSVSCSS